MNAIANKKAVPLKLDIPLLDDLDNLVDALNVSRTALITEGVRNIVKEKKRTLLAEKIKRASAKVRNSNREIMGDINGLSHEIKD